MTPLCSKWGLKINMINKLLGAAAMAAVAFAVVPASAAKMGGCSGENLGKTESMIETMADGEGKITTQKEVAQAQTAMLAVSRDDMSMLCHTSHRSVWFRHTSEFLRIHDLRLSPHFCGVSA